MRWLSFLPPLALACSSATPSTDTPSERSPTAGDQTTSGEESGHEAPGSATTGGSSDLRPTADVVGVQVSGDPGAYTFSVRIRSDETGCDRYADWWEVVHDDGSLIYRRILNHSHPDEQPFERSGGPVDVLPDAPLFVRAHHHPSGYSGTVFGGSVRDGFGPTTVPPGFAEDLSDTAPLPEDCWY